MNFITKLSARIGMEDVKEILCLIRDNEGRKEELYTLVRGADETVGYYAAWVFTHLTSQENPWLYPKQNELIDEVLTCKHKGKRRLILNLLYKQPFVKEIRVDFLDFCLERMSSVEELPGVKSLCIKIAYELCFPFPELTNELKTTLEMIEGHQSPAILSIKNNVLKAMQKGKRLPKV
ncbi:hypothetical protein O2K51_07310 [Apibacter raozihei]|uniref:hypothetical protein n=1 Tax=Apibacter raozihei TaxID=2500547 RepID=UPI000FE348DE|nr:hypothetical protein [Apibacter raozihei]